MPEHSSFITYLLQLFPGIRENAANIGSLVMSGKPVRGDHVDAAATSILVAMLVFVVAGVARSRLASPKKALEPETKLSLSTFLELFLGYFYTMAKDVMGPKRAKRYFPIIGGCAVFIFFSNCLALIPGMVPPTSSLNITLGCAILVFIAFNYYGIKENGVGYLKHLFGPWIGPAGIPVNLLIFVVECISLCVRPVTLAVRLMINMAVDHLIASIFLGLFALFLPIPTMMLAVIVILVQTVVFCLLTAVYIGMATEHDH